MYYCFCLPSFIPAIVTLHTTLRPSSSKLIQLYNFISVVYRRAHRTLRLVVHCTMYYCSLDRMRKLFCFVNWQQSTGDCDRPQDLLNTVRRLCAGTIYWDNGQSDVPTIEWWMFFSHTEVSVGNCETVQAPTLRKLTPLQLVNTWQWEQTFLFSLLPSEV